MLGSVARSFGERAAMSWAFSKLISACDCGMAKVGALNLSWYRLRKGTKIDVLWTIYLQKAQLPLA